MMVSYTIREVAAAAGVSAHTLRYYEEAGIMPEVPRRPNGHRCYGDDHVRWIRFLRRLRLAGMSIAQVREYAALAGQGEQSMVERAAMLADHRDQVKDQIRELNEHLELIEAKLERFAESGVACGPQEKTGWGVRSG